MRWLPVLGISTLLLSACNGRQVVADGAVPDAGPGHDIFMPMDVPWDLYHIPDTFVVPDAPRGDGPVTRDGPLTADSFVPMDGGGLIKVTFTADEAAKYCTTVGTCLQQSVNECLSNLYAEGDAPLNTVSCIATGTNGCDRLGDCVGYDYEPVACGTTIMQCSGTDWVICAPGPLKVTVDCMKVFGTGCKNTGSSNISAGCSAGTPCSGPGSYCKGSLVAQCVSGTEILMLNCAQAGGLPCRGGGCAGPGEACYGGTVCEGSDVIAFCVEGYRLRMKCSEIGPGFSCVSSTVSGARCQQGTQCDPGAAKGTESCAGSSLVLCNGGKTVQVDCKALGFSGCSGGFCTL